MLNLVAIGHKMPAWVSEGFEEYRHRLPKPYDVNLIEIPLHKRTTPGDTPRLMEKEGQEMLAKIPREAFVVTLEIQVPPWSTEQFAVKFSEWRQRGQAIYFLIGGPEGLASECLKRANARWSLSPLTLPHPMVRLVMIEQLYRAYTILTGHPYHK